MRDDDTGEEGATSSDSFSPIRWRVRGDPYVSLEDIKCTVFAWVSASIELVDPACLVPELCVSRGPLSPFGFLLYIYPLGPLCPGLVYMENNLYLRTDIPVYLPVGGARSLIQAHHRHACQ
jgi:hypothetical protein